MKVPPRPEAGDRTFFRSVLPEDARVGVRPLFGNDAAFVNGNMFAGLFGERLFLRLSDPDQEELLKEEGASRFSPMEGRPMRGYVMVPKAWRADPQKARVWVARSLAWAAGLPPKAAKKR